MLSFVTTNFKLSQGTQTGKDACLEIEVAMLAEPGVQRAKVLVGYFL